MASVLECVVAPLTVTAPVPMVTAPVEVRNVPVLPEKLLAVDPLAVKPPFNVAEPVNVDTPVTPSVPVNVLFPDTERSVPIEVATTDPPTARAVPTAKAMAIFFLFVKNFLLIVMVLCLGKKKDDC